jgi:hypothetical protein
MVEVELKISWDVNLYQQIRVPVRIVLFVTLKTENFFPVKIGMGRKFLEVSAGMETRIIAPIPEQINKNSIFYSCI